MMIRWIFFILTAAMIAIPTAGLAQNTPPIADAGPDQTIFVGDYTLLEGSATDPNGNPIIDWLWAVESAPVGSTPWFSDTDNPDPLFRGDIAGDYVLSLVASDGMDWSEPDLVTIHVVENQPPVAVAAARPTTGKFPLTVQFDGTDSFDPEEGPLSYEWDFGDGTPHAYEASPTHVYDGVVGDITIRLTVTDERGAYAIDEVTITVVLNTPPIADAGPDQTVFVGATALLQGSATDSDGNDIVEWLWAVESSPPGSTPFFSDTITPDPLFAGDIIGDYVLSLKASDGMDWSEPDLVTIHVVENQPPVAVASSDVTTGPAPLTVNFDGTQSYDPEGGPLDYEWTFGDGFVAEGPTATHTYISPGEYSVELRVIDDNLQADIDVLTITVTAPNNPPVANPTATPPSGSAPLSVQFTANASDPDSDPLTCAWEFGDDNTSTEENPVHEYENPGTYIAWLTVSDGDLEVTESLTIAVNSDLTISMRTATVTYTNLRKKKGNVTVWADFNGSVPDGDDLVSIIFDGKKLFEKPFYAFKLGLLPNVYYVVRRKLLVRIDFNTHRILVERTGINLKKVNNDNGVDVEMILGDSTAVENIVMTEAPNGDLVYIRNGNGL